MGGHGHGHGPPYMVPHYSSFSANGIPQLQDLQKALAKKGLCDPWMRNEAWRYHPGFGTPLRRANAAVFRGFPIGLGLAVVTAVLGKLLSGADDHGHDGNECH